MSRLEKFFVNRSAERNARDTLDVIGKSGINIPERSSILELGAGKGAVSYLIHQRFAPNRMVVTDYDASQMALAESYFKSKLGTIPDGVEIRRADALSLPFPDESFDAVFTSHVLHHVEKHEWDFENIPTALSEIRRVLKTDGLFIYEEIFNKSRIQECLTELGFDKIFEKGNWPSKLCVYRKGLGPEQNTTPFERLP